MSWTANEMPDLGGKTIVVTGANSGLGLEASRAFARRRARVVLACRNVEKAEAARNDILGSAPGADVEVEPLDLASLASVRAFAESFLSRHGRLDVLCNNAGVMALPRRETVDAYLISGQRRRAASVS